MIIYTDNNPIRRNGFPLIPKNAKFPCIILEYDNWNDFGFNTLYYASIYDESGNILVQGLIKIGKDGIRLNDIPLISNNLPEGYFSLWQEVDYYKIIVTSHLKSEILTSLNDLCFFEKLRILCSDLYVVRNSLRRYSEAEKAYIEGYELLQKIDIDRKFNFKYSGVFDETKFPSVHFDFSEKHYDLKRICAIIGKNGAGKTTLLSNIASSLSGIDKENLNIKERPPFSKVIAISFSIFDNFYKPEEGERTFSYSYFGVRGRSNELVSSENIKSTFLNLYYRIASGSLISYWQKAFEILLGKRQLRLFNDNTDIVDAFDSLSSGQKFMIYSFTQIISTIKINSLLLFDEPETHLHPNGQSALLACLQDILEEFSSFAIIATHSPVFLQGILKENTILLSKVGENRVVNRLVSESFGQNFSILTEEIFGFTEENHFFVEKLKSLIKKNGKTDSNLIEVLRKMNSNGVDYILESLL
ncbi:MULTISPECIES: AAA family ATPase [unclassified Leptospira]|uniref:AAA family ATPase n=1 Tax=unclassified Leptospira TaxID=2633828 RepID=UPI0002BE73F1|nr:MULTISPECIES: AAA family ATPase [unclassified Leptospira]EMK01212.1 AAA domain protein [Leptospira sp. B5-022]MCR1795447.1 AAA family ATPase [Leptospira sp. id769339]